MISYRSLAGALCMVAASALLVWPAASPAESRPLSRVAAISAAELDWSGGELYNLAVTPEGLHLAPAAGRAVGAPAGGFFVSPVRDVGEPFDQVQAALRLPEGVSGTVEVDVRTSQDAERWSSWSRALGDGSIVGLPAGRYFQYRVELAGEAAERPGLLGVDFDVFASGAAAPEVAGEHPTVRVFATREGLVGRNTANGHLIEERDRFAALPSKRALNPKDKRDYEVRISYKGRSSTVPVWDVGPWNTKDNYWDERRELFGDLGRFVPQALAAWQSDYNGGRDQYGRWVSFPSSMDIADGTFVDDLGMRTSDWVDVTFLWVDAPSPKRGDTPAVTGLKPEPKPAIQGDGTVWYFAEGNTKPPFETTFVVQNPNSDPVRVLVSFITADRGVQRKELTVEPNGRATVSANQLLPDAEFGVKFEASKPILVERTVLFGADGHSTVGVTAPSRTWYVPEGSSQAPFSTWLLLENPGSTPAAVKLTFMRETGGPQVSELVVPATARRSVYANEIVERAGFATSVDSDVPIVVEASVYLAGGGGHATVGAAQPSRTWYLAEGSTEIGFDTWILVQNPGDRAATVTLTYLPEQGESVSRKLTVRPTSRIAISARESMAGRLFGAMLESDQAVVVERATYFGGAPDGQGTGAHASIAAPQPAKTWYLPEGSTKEPYTEIIAVANPNDTDARVRVDFVRSDGGLVGRDYVLDARRRLTIDVNAEVPSQVLSARVGADQPIVVERTSYFNGGSGGTSSLGIAR